MSNLFFRLPTILPNSAALPALAEADVSYLSWAPEYGATAHWVFGGAGGLTDVIGGNVLTPMSDVPANNGNFITLNAAVGKAVVSPFADGLVDDTVAVIVRPRVTSSSVLWGNASATSGQGGSLIGVATNDATTPRFGVSATPSGVYTTFSTGLFTNNSWHMMVFGRNFTRSSPKYMAAQLNQNARIILTVGTEPIIPAANLSLGSNRYANGTGEWDIAEVIYWRGYYFTTADFADIYSRRKKMSAMRGIAIP